MTVVIKIGGSIVSEGLYSGILEDIAKSVKERFIIVHGGGNEVSKYQKALGKEPVFVTSPEGIRSRYTDRETVDIYNMVMRKIGSEMALKLSSLGLRSVSLSGIDGGTLVAERKKKLVIIDERGRKRAIDGGYTGRIKETNPSLLNLLLENGFVPVVSPVAVSYEWEPLNVDGDRAAAAVAAAVKATSLIIFTNVDGVIVDGKVKEKMTVSEARETIARVGPGMDKKIMACVEAVEGGVKEGIIANGRVSSPFSNAVNGLRTVISNE